MDEYTEEQKKVIRMMAAAFPSSKRITWIDDNAVRNKDVPTLGGYEVKTDEVFSDHIAAAQYAREVRDRFREKLRKIDGVPAP